MQRLHILLCSVLALGLIGLSGCKKDEAEASPEPEKVSEPETATKSGALSEETPETPSERKLKVQKNDSKSKAKNKIPKSVERAGKSADRSAKKPRDAKKDVAAKKPAAKAKPTAANRPTRPTAKAPARRPGANRVPPAKREAAAQDDAEQDEYDDTAPREKNNDRGRLAKGPRAKQPMREARGDRLAQADPPPRPARDTARPDRGPNDARFRNNRRTPSAVPAASKRDTGNARPAGLPTRVRPNAEQLLRKEDLVELLKLKAAVDVHELSGIAADHEYDGIYWGSPDGSKYYVGIQLWKMRSPIEAQRQYTQMVRSYPNAEETTAVTSKTFLAYWNEFIYLVFLDTTKQSVIAVTCHEKVCTEPSMLVGIAQKSRERL